MPDEMKNRHGCLTAWLILMIVANSLSLLMYLVMAAGEGEAMREAFPDMPVWAIPALIVLSAFNVACAIALFRWKKWGFWGFCATSAIGLPINLYLGVGVPQSIAGLLGVVLLFAVLHIGKDNKGWPQLE